MVELSAIWVVVIVLVGIAIGVYSVCKGCQGMQEHAAQTAQQDRMTVHSLVAPYAGLVQQRPEDANQSRLFLISEASLHDKNPPSYDEIIEPPPSYEETVKSGGAEGCSPSDDHHELSTHVNLACDVTLEESGATACAATSLVSDNVPVHSETTATTASESVSVNIET